jgi:hypothetical protein
MRVFSAELQGGVVAEREAGAGDVSRLANCRALASCTRICLWK